MQIKIEIKPNKVVAGTKEELNSKIRSRFSITSYMYSTSGSGLHVGFGSSDAFIMINYQKFRSKRGKRKAHWVGYVYKFEENFLRGTGLSVKQNNRNFEIKKTK